MITPVGVPEELLAWTVNIAWFSSRAGFGAADNVTVGAAKTGELLFTKTEAPPPELLPNVVLVVASSPPVKLAVYECVPEIVTTVSRDAHPYTFNGALPKTVAPSLKETVPTGIPPSELTVAMRVTVCPILVVEAEVAICAEVEA